MASSTYVSSIHPNASNRFSTVITQTLFPANTFEVFQQAFYLRAYVVSRFAQFFRYLRGLLEIPQILDKHYPVLFGKRGDKRVYRFA